MRDFFKAIIQQLLFAGLGFFMAWVCLEGSAKTICGWATLGAFAVWFATYRWHKDD
jgi:hypothetical protein